ncbi:junctional adhesion molecule A [Eleutherodactylus coqui]|uniref:junctional adhesion molecule A n=1 Tax=Eleutherodactylus coqui TaxID=57060 RepID=UPI003461AD2F
MISLDVELTCNYPSSYQNPRIEWKFDSGKDTVLVYYNGETDWLILSLLLASYKNRAQYYPQGLRLRGVTRKDAGEYVCEVSDTSSGSVGYMEVKTQLQVQVPPSVPVAQVPTSASIGSSVTLACVENDGFPRPKISWYKNNILMPENPKSNPIFQNTTYTMDPKTARPGNTFNPVMQLDSGEYLCEASNANGLQRSTAIFMETYERNVGGIVAAVIIVLLILGLIAFGVWFAYSRGYIGKKTNKKVIYSQPSETRSDKNFQQTSSFVV